MAPKSLFSERAGNGADIPAPIRSQGSTCHISMEAAVRPIAYARYQSMLDRVEMDIVNVVLEIPFVANNVLPISPLPDPLLPFSDITRRAYGRRGKATGKPALDATPSHWKICVFRR